MFDYFVWFDKELFELAMIYCNFVWFVDLCETVAKTKYLFSLFILLLFFVAIKNSFSFKILLDKSFLLELFKKILLICILFIISDNIALLLKNTIARMRPGVQTGLYFRPNAFCMPSSHAWNLMFLGVLLRGLFPQVKNYFIIVAIIVGLARFFSQYHFLSDVVLGWFGGAILAYFVLAILKAYNTKNNMQVLYKYFIFSILVCFFIQCNNNPYSLKDSNKKIYYDTFEQEPKYLDPALAYSEDEYRILQQIYEPPLQYHFLKRPYELIPLTLKKMPTIHQQGTKYIYTLEFKSDIFYAPHPAFSKNKNGSYTYHLGAKDTFNNKIENPQDLPHKGTRLLTAEDYAYQIKRLAHPQISCPIYSVLENYIEGFSDYSKSIATEIKSIREQRRKLKGLLYNQELDERENPIYIDLRKYNLSGVKVKDNNVLEITLKQAYPQFIYWLAMPFFSPMPWEADRFYTQHASKVLNLSINRFPIGTGPFILSLNQPHYRMELSKNQTYHSDFFPNDGEESDKVGGKILDAGQQLPFLDKAVYVLEKESIPRWNKFLQGYYDTSGTPTDVFNSIIQVKDSGIDLTDTMKKRSIQLITAETSIIYYYAFNMLDDVVGGYSIRNKKLRQAISIALDIEEYIQIFLNDRGIAAQSIIAPGIFGYDSTWNPIVYNWDSKNKRRVRKDISVAKQLMVEAGYPNGVDKNGNRLILYYDAYQLSSDKSDIYWLKKQFQKIGIDLQIRSTDYNQFRQKVDQGNYQFLRWGWHADYPDAENFLFLLYGPNAGSNSGGKNEANYSNPQYDKLFKQMETMSNTPERLKIIQQMITISREDSPWIWGFHPINYALYHSWYKNTKPMTISYGTLKYKKIDVKLRNQYVSEKY